MPNVLEWKIKYRPNQVDLIAGTPPPDNAPTAHRDFATTGEEHPIEGPERVAAEEQVARGKGAEAPHAVEPDPAAHPTLPSREMLISFCASMANSIGRCWMTSLTKPLTINATASSVPRPRLLQ